MLEIKRSSRLIRMAFQGVIAALPVLFIWFWVNAPDSAGWPEAGFGYSFLPDGLKILHELTIQDRIIGFVLTAIPLALYLYMLVSLVRLFKLYEKGVVFTLANVKYLRNIGLLLMLAQVASFLIHPLLTLAMSFGNIPGERYIEIYFRDTSMGLFLVGMMVVIIAKIMNEATRLNKEQQLTI